MSSATLIDFEQDQQTQAIELLSEIREGYPELFVIGAEYSRTVSTLWGDAMFCAKKGDIESARYFTRSVLDAIRRLEVIA